MEGSWLADVFFVLVGAFCHVVARFFLRNVAKGNLVACGFWACLAFIFVLIVFLPLMSFHWLLICCS